MLTQRFEDAFRYTLAVHGGQLRKGTQIPYIGHLLAVTGTVIEYQGDEDQAIAALLHDAVEDQGGEERLADIQRRFGPRVAEIVRDCSDSVEVDPARKRAWEERKKTYIAGIEAHGLDTILVSLSDKVSNARSIIRDLHDPTIGSSLWDRFKGKRDGTIWYYRSLARAYQQALDGLGQRNSRLFQLAEELGELAEAMARHDPAEPA